LNQCEAALCTAVLPSAGVTSDESVSNFKTNIGLTIEKLERYLFTFGELAQVLFGFIFIFFAINQLLKNGDQRMINYELIVGL
jgi:hypothetical protein